MFRFNATMENPVFELSATPFKPQLLTFMGLSSDCSVPSSSTNTELSSSQLSSPSDRPSTSFATAASTRTKKPCTDNINCSGDDDQLVLVTHVNTPHQFYVELNDFSKVADSFLALCTKESQYAAKPSVVALDTLYLVKQRKWWHRAMVVANQSDYVYTVFFVDNGQSEEVAADRYLFSL